MKISKRFQKKNSCLYKVPFAIFAKKGAPTMMKKHWIIGLGFVMMFCSCDQPDTKAYLKKVIENLESIESVEYQCRHIAWEPYVADPMYDLYMARICQSCGYCVWKQLY